MIRKARQADVPGIRGLLAPYFSEYPRLRPDAEKVHEGLTRLVSGAEHFAWVGVSEDGEVTGVLLGYTADNLWAQRKRCHVLAWVSRAPSKTEGLALLRQFVGWLDERPAIKVAGFAPDFDTDPRPWKIVERFGFRKYGGAYLRYKGEEHGSL
jgi:hypothetical protein